MDQQVPLRQVLEFEPSSDGSYSVTFPPSVCYGDFVSGGISMAVIHKAAIDFVSKNPKTAGLTNVLNTNFIFHRPTFAGPKSVIEFRVCNANKLVTTLHVQLRQKKPCLEGFIMLTDFSREGLVSLDKNWKLDPAPIPTTPESLASDRDPNWISYQCPFPLATDMKPHSYLRYHASVTYQSSLVIDQWISPAWEDPALPDGAVWTNELLHFVLDNGAVLYQSEEDDRLHHAEALKVALQQRKARQQGRKIEIAAPDLRVPYTTASLSITTGFKKLLPPEGTKWLFMRASTKGIVDDRMDQDLLILDEHGSLIATSHHIVAIIPRMMKEMKL